MSVRSLFTETSLLSASNYFVIDVDSRSITAPTNFKNFGVESDENTNRVYFECPKIVGNNIDLSTLNLRVNFRNANDETDQYIINDVTVDGDLIHFSWLLSRKVTQYKGTIYFIVCAVKTDTNGVIVNEWNTAVCTGQVIEGLEVETPLIPEDTYDVINQLLDLVNNAVVNVENAEANAINNIADSLDKTLSVSGKAAEAQSTGYKIETKANAIISSKQGNNIVVNDASESILKGLTVYGKTTQDGTPTPETPIDLISIEDPEINVYGENLIDTTKFLLHANESLIISENGYEITVVGGKTGGYISSVQNLDVETLKGKTLILKQDEQKNSISGSKAGTQITVTTSEKKEYIALYETVNEKIVEIPLNATSVQIAVYSNNSGNALETNNTVIVKGLSLSLLGNEWEQYKEVQNLSLPYSLKGIPVSSGGNYVDENGQEWLCDEIDLERGVYIQRCYLRHYDYTEFQYQENNSFNIYAYDENDYDIINGDGLMLSNKATYPLNENNSCRSVLAGCRFRFDEVTSIEELGELMPDGIECLFIRKTPLEILLTEDEINAYKSIKSNSLITTVLNTENAYMTFKYAVDLETYIKNNYVSINDYLSLEERVKALEGGA